MQISGFKDTNIQGVVSPALWQDKDAYLRRQLLYELQGLQEKVANFQKEDELSKNLINWLTSFTQAVKLQQQAGQKAPLDKILERYTAYLQQFLRTNIPPFVPFDEEVLLGSDGQGYGKKFLSLYLYHEKPGLRRRSPIPTNATPFMVTRHRCAEEFVKWLKGRNGLLRSKELETDYYTLDSQGLLPPLPFPHQVAQEEEDAMIAAAINEVESIIPFAQEVFNQQQIKMDDHVFEEKTLISSAQVALEVAEKAFYRGIEDIENQIQKEESHLQHNQQNISKLQGRMDQAEAANIQIQKGIQDVQEALNRKQRDSMGGFFQFAGSFVASLAVTLVIQQFAPGFSLDFTNGGGLLKYSKFF